MNTFVKSWIYDLILLVITGSGIGLLPIQRQAITWLNDGAHRQLDI